MGSAPRDPVAQVVDCWLPTPGATYAHRGFRVSKGADVARPARQFTDSEIGKALMELVRHNNNAAAASRALKDEHNLSVGAAKLIEWRDTTYPDRYEQARDTRAAVLANEAEDLAHAYARAEWLALNKTVESIEEGTVDPRDLGGLVRNLATAKGINLSNANVLRGRPTSITESRGAEDIMRSLFAKLNVVDSTAEEVHEIDAGNDEGLPEESP